MELMLRVSLEQETSCHGIIFWRHHLKCACVDCDVVQSPGNGSLNNCQVRCLDISAQIRIARCVATKPKHFPQVTRVRVNVVLRSTCWWCWASILEVIHFEARQQHYGQQASDTSFLAGDLWPPKRSDRVMTDYSLKWSLAADRLLHVQCQQPYVVMSFRLHYPSSLAAAKACAMMKSLRLLGSKSNH